jgi:hypothetical protein
MNSRGLQNQNLVIAKIYIYSLDERLWLQYVGIVRLIVIHFQALRIMNGLHFISYIITIALVT